MGAKKMRTLCVGLLLALGSFVACNDIGDANDCNYGSNLQEPRSECPYGPPGGPGVQEQGAAGCPTITVDKADPGCADNTWAGAIWPTLSASCTGSGCHDDGAGNGAAGIYLPGADAAAAFAGLKAYQNNAGYSYVSDTDPEHSWILCNLKGQPGGGDKMPLGRDIAPGLINTIEAWAKCGQL
jgi:hypothetical protein